MITCYHGSPELFKKFDLSKAGDGTGIKFGFGVYLTESEASAVPKLLDRFYTLRQALPF